MPLVLERFWAKVDLAGADGCWEWQAAKFVDGYGMFKMPGRAGKVVRAHRFAYEVLVGLIPTGLTIDHLCCNRACVNPDHLEPVTGAENTRRAVPGMSKKTHCPRGHAYDAQNTRVGRDGFRRCRACDRITNAHSNARRKASQ